jgi:UDP-N-acetylmuramate dehydrogenase
MSLPVDSKTFIHTDVPLKSYSTFKIGGVARYFAEPATREELFQVLDFQRIEHLPLLVIGRGSNLLVSDHGFRGLALSLRSFEPAAYSVENGIFLHVSGGMSLFRVALLSQECSLGGAEFLCHIPGTVGGAVVMNAGFGRPNQGYHEIKDILHSFTVIDLNSGVLKTFRREDILFEYRKTHLPNDSLVVEAIFKLNPKPKTEVEAEIKANFAYRNLVQDLRFPSAGSTFKNQKTTSLTSGQMLDRAGMKGMREGGAMVSERHANFFLNVNHATAQDVLSLISTAQKRVFEQFGIQLEPEVRYVGEPVMSS